jgi:hypothetical protein
LAHCAVAATANRGVSSGGTLADGLWVVFFNTPHPSGWAIKVVLFPLIASTRKAQQPALQA